jgi:hypothetical protein
MKTEVQRQGSPRKQASDSDGNGGDQCRCEKNIFQPWDFAIDGRLRGKHCKEIIEKGQSRPGHDKLVKDGESSEWWWDIALEERGNCEESAKKQCQQPCVGVVSAEQQNHHADDKKT